MATPKKTQNNKPVVHNYFYAKEELIPNNLLYSWFKEGATVKVVLKATDDKGVPYMRMGKIMAVGQFEITLLENKEALRVIYKHEISNIIKKNEE